VLDLVGIVFSSLMMVFVIYRAVQLDAVLPWFQKVSADAAPDEAAAQPGRFPGRRPPTRPVPPPGRPRFPRR
jgi:hypothetical protein